MEKDILLGYVGDVIIRINSWFKAACLRGKGIDKKYLFSCSS